LNTLKQASNVDQHINAKLRPIIRLKRKTGKEEFKHVNNIDLDWNSNGKLNRTTQITNPKKM
jgi:hypothetical protein